MKIDDVLNIIKLIPIAITAVKSLEEFIPVSGAGKAKLDLVLSTLKDGYTLISDAWPSVEPVIAKLITGLVSLANQFGVFKKATPTE